jgi:hypothetical protein
MRLLTGKLGSPYRSLVICFMTLVHLRLFLFLYFGVSLPFLGGRRELFCLVCFCVNLAGTGARGAKPEATFW